MYKKSTNVNNQNLILFRYFGRKSNNPNKTVFMAMKLIPIWGKAPPYSLRMVLKKETYSNKDNKAPKTIYPIGLKYFELDIKMR